MTSITPSMEDQEDRILLVEDDERISSRLVSALAEAVFSVDLCDTLAEARTKAFSGYALILLDLGLPDGDGLALCRELRAAGDTTPIIILTARNTSSEIVRGLEAGADDYVSKPLQLSVLTARIRAAVRRSENHQRDERLNCGSLWLDPQSNTAGLGEAVIELKRREFSLLEFLMRHQGQAWTRTQLLSRVWGADFVGGENTVNIHIGRLRARIEEDASRPRFIQTVWGVGYRLVEDGGRE